MMTQTSYDDIPYPSYPRMQTHPALLGMWASLRGMSVAPASRCRVLEIGCSTGGNLVPMAYTLPESEFVGFDLSQSQVDEACRFRDRLGLTNLRLEQADLMDLPEDYGKFDYIIAHGVFSWVPRPVQDGLLAACQLHLAPQGVAFISYNTLPGWHLRKLVRQTMLYRTRGIEDPQEKIRRSREVLDLLTLHRMEEDDGFRAYLQEERRAVQYSTDAYIYHEHLEEFNEPLYISEFIRRVESHGLQYLGDAEDNEFSLQALPAHVGQRLRKMDQTQRELYKDFLYRRVFRQSLICHRSVNLAPEYQPAQVRNFYVSGDVKFLSERPDLRGPTVEEFQGANRISASTSHALSKAAIACLRDLFPQPIAFEDLLVAARQRLAGDAVVAHSRKRYLEDEEKLIENLFQSFQANLIQFTTAAPPMTRRLTERPIASALVRLQIEEGHDRFSSLLHSVKALDEMTRHCVRHMDGHHDLGQLVELLLEYVQENQVVIERHGRPVQHAAELRRVLSEELEVNLQRVADSGMLLAEDVSS